MSEFNTDKPYRFIPYRKHDIVEMCLLDGNMAGQEDDLRQLYYMLSSIFHFEFHQIVESLKDSYALVDPDADTCSFDNRRPLSELSFIELLDNLLEKANYERITQKDFGCSIE